MYKSYSDSTLKGMTKDNLISIIRCLEHNISVLEERNSNQFALLMDKEKYIVLCLPGEPGRREIRKIVRARCAGWGAVEVEIYPGAGESLVLAHPARAGVYISAAALRVLAHWRGE